MSDERLPAEPRPGKLEPRPLSPVERLVLASAPDEQFDLSLIRDQDLLERG